MKQNQGRPGVMVYFHLFDMLKFLDTRQVGEMMLALMAYAREGVEPDFTEQVMRVVWISMKNAADLDKVHYEEKRAQAQAASAKRWGKDASASERMRTVPINNNNTTTETDTTAETNTKADADAITQASASANTETEKETPGAVSPRRELPPLEIPPNMTDSISYRRMADASRGRLSEEEFEQRRQEIIRTLQRMPD